MNISCKMSDEDKKFGTICRVCLNFNSDISKGLSLFEEYNDCKISDQINAISNVGIVEGDGMPDKICPTCLLELQGAYKFKLKCETTNEILLSAVNNVKTNVEELEESLHMKEEYLDNDYTENILLEDMQGNSIDENSHNNPPKKCMTNEPLNKPSRAIDLKLICNECGGSFKSKCKLRVHWKKVHLTDSLKCTSCLRIFKSYSAYNNHKKKNLQICAAAANKVRIEGEGRNRVFYCKECNYKSLRMKDVTSHSVIHTGERPFQCNICLKTFTQLSSVTAHKESHHKIYTGEGTCQFCGKLFLGKSKLYRHMRQHRQDRFPCKICKSVLKSKESLKNHMKRHSGVKSYSCEVCPTSFYTSSELSNHKAKVHLKSKLYVCQICNYKTFSHGIMARHKPKHSISNYACNVCGMFLENDQQLTLHKKRHTDRHYPCPHCDKKYYTRKSLCSHIRKIHKIVKLTIQPTPKACIKSESVKEIQL